MLQQHLDLKVLKVILKAKIDIPEEIYDALNSSFPFECMQALYAIED